MKPHTNRRNIALTEIDRQLANLQKSLSHPNSTEEPLSIILSILTIIADALANAEREAEELWLKLKM